MTEQEINRNPALAHAREELLRCMGLAGSVPEDDFVNWSLDALCTFEVEVRADERNKDRA